MLVTGTPVYLETAKHVFLSGRGSPNNCETHVGILNTIFEEKLSLSDIEFKMQLMKDKNSWLTCPIKTRERLQILLQEDPQVLKEIECSLDQFGHQFVHKKLKANLLSKMKSLKFK